MKSGHTEWNSNIMWDFENRLSMNFDNTWQVSTYCNRLFHVFIRFISVYNKHVDSIDALQRHSRALEAYKGHLPKPNKIRAQAENVLEKQDRMSDCNVRYWTIPDDIGVINFFGPEGRRNNLFPRRQLEAGRSDGPGLVSSTSNERMCRLM